MKKKICVALVAIVLIAVCAVSISSKPVVGREEVATNGIDPW